MKTKAAVLKESPGRLEILELDMDDLRKGEIRVKMRAAGLCHSDDHFVKGDQTPGVFPIVLGHEGAGVVEAIGPDTEGFEIGDHVVFSFLPVCGRCKWCSKGMQSLCDLGAYLSTGSRFEDPGTYRLSLDGQPVGALASLGTFAEHVTVSAISAIKYDPSIPFEIACLAGCGVGTGWGSAVNSGEVSPGDVTIVMGVGGIGINAVQGAAHAGARAVIAVDPVEFKRDWALKLGATHAFEDIDAAADFARSITNGQGADQTIVTVGVTTGKHVGQALEATRKGGTTVATGIGAATVEAGDIDLHHLTLMQKRLQGSLFGSSNPLADIPAQLDLYQQGYLHLDELVTKRYRLEEVNEGYADMLAGSNLRGVIVFDD
ncbi:NDMA-dependent alcohol dehydrogenase [Gordonia sp. X0973]|uniref:NDMA-dependent alcohol dehydrogenase n=1 Tax=Gordonia sp. X0973 TaxID=2742602 RepID=UPI000F54133E|nr:NDMA-dependent alcohol dehydrogenase [Gordonia sp. X0973]QKT08807.1 NDMA-dependent alcohol dehydrogenase [Gordonia sp. X0973]